MDHCLDTKNIRHSDFLMYFKNIFKKSYISWQWYVLTGGFLFSVYFQGKRINIENKISFIGYYFLIYGRKLMQTAIHIRSHANRYIPITTPYKYFYHKPHLQAWTEHLNLHKYECFINSFSKLLLIVVFVISHLQGSAMKYLPKMANVLSRNANPIYLQC